MKNQPRQASLVLAAIALVALSACVDEEQIKRMQALNAQVQERVATEYFPKVGGAMKYCIDLQETGAGNEADILSAGFTREELIFGGVGYSAEWRADPVFSRVAFDFSRGNCRFKLSGVDLKAHREAMAQGLRDLGFELTAISPTPPEDDPLGQGVLGGLGIGSSDIQFAKRGDMVLRMVRSSNPASRQGGYTPELIYKVDGSPLPFE